MMIWVVVAVDGVSAPKVTCFNNKEAAIEYANNMAANHWNVAVQKEVVLSTVPVNQKHNLSFAPNDKIDGRVLVLNA
jgi:hypothetical protein